MTRIFLFVFVCCLNWNSYFQGSEYDVETLFFELTENPKLKQFLFSDSSAGAGVPMVLINKPIVRLIPSIKRVVNETDV